MIGAAATGLVLDLLLHRPLLLSPFLLAAALAAGWGLRRKHMDHLLDAAMPGMAIGVINTLGDALFIRWAGGSGVSSGTLLWELLFHGAAGMGLLPCVVFLFDALSGALDLPRFLGKNQSPLERRRWGSRPRTVKEHTVNPGRRRNS